MTAPADCLVSTKVLFNDYTFSFSFILSFHLLIIAIMSLFRDGIKMKIFFTFNNNLSKN